MERLRGSVRVAIGIVIGSIVSWTTIGAVAEVGASPSPNSVAQISVDFSGEATHFVAASSKDISFVEIHFADGRVVKDESTVHPNFSYEGNDAISSVVVKSGTTTLSFTPPTQCNPEVDDCEPAGND